MNKLLDGKTGVVFGVANKNSIAWGIAKAWHDAGARLVFTYQGERLKDKVQKLVSDFGDDTLVMECDVSNDDDIDRVFKEVDSCFSGKLDMVLHSVAFAPREALEGRFVDTTRDAFSTAQSKLDLPLETEIAPVNLGKPNEEQHIRAVQGSR